MKFFSWIIFGVLLTGFGGSLGQNQTEGVGVSSANITAGSENVTGNGLINSFAINLVVSNSTIAPVTNTNETSSPSNTTETSIITPSPLPATTNTSDQTITNPPESQQNTNSTTTSSPVPSSNSISNTTVPEIPPQNLTIPSNSTSKATSMAPAEYTPATGWGTFLLAFGVVVIAGLVLSAFYFKSKNRGSRNEFSPLLSELESDM